MKSYKVTWDVDIDAESPEEAAQKALAIQRNPKSWATTFKVVAYEGVKMVDLYSYIHPTTDGFFAGKEEVNDDSV